MLSKGSSHLTLHTVSNGDQVSSGFHEWCPLSYPVLVSSICGGGLKYTAYSFIHLSAGQIFVETLRIQTMHQGLFCNGEQDGSGLLSSRSFRGGTSKRQQSAARGRVWHSVTAHYRPGPRYACVSSSVLLNNSPVLQMRKKKRYLPKVTG